MTFVPSKYQKDIFNEVSNTNNNIVVDAAPGSGKSVSMIEATKLFPTYTKNIFVAFNKSIVNELKEKLPPYIECSTVHSLGMKALRRHYDEKFKITQYKNLNFIQPFTKELEMNKDDKFIYEILISDIINFAKINCIDINKESFKELCDGYGFSYDDLQIEIALQAFNNILTYDMNEVSENYRFISFVDMIYLPIKLDLKLPKYDNVCFDEAQDASYLQQKIVESIVKDKGRIIYTGDQKQSIYSFQGSHSQIFIDLKDKPNTTSLPLSISYRCAKQIVDLANKVYNKIEYFEENPEGVVRTGHKSEIKEGDMVLCRNTRPLVELYFKLIKDGKKAHLLGRDIETNLLNLIHKFKDESNDKEELLKNLKGHLGEIQEELAEKGVYKPKEHIKYLNFYEKLMVISVVSDNCRNSNEVIKTIKEIFREEKDDVILSTIHKSKGLENEKVFIINRDLIPSSYAKKDWELEQERNLLYVAITRAKNELVIEKENSDEGLEDQEIISNFVDRINKETDNKKQKKKRISK